MYTVHVHLCIKKSKPSCTNQFMYICACTCTYIHACRELYDTCTCTCTYCCSFLYLILISPTVSIVVCTYVPFHVHIHGLVDFTSRYSNIAIGYAPTTVGIQTQTNCMCMYISVFILWINAYVYMYHFTCFCTYVLRVYSVTCCHQNKAQ